MRLKDKVALITGGASGIGRETAVLFAAEGAKVAVADLNEAGGAETAGRIRQAGGEAIFVRADVSRAGDCRSMVQAAETARKDVKPAPVLTRKQRKNKKAQRRPAK